MAIYQYSRGADGKTVERISNDGGKTFTETGTGKVTSGNTGTSKYGYSSGNNQYTGNTGKQYNVSGANGAITVNRPDGTTSTVQRGDADYQATLDAMQKDGVNYTPNTTYTNQNGTYTAKSYTAGNSDLQYALQQAAKTNPGISVGDYAESLYNRVGSTRSDGSMVTLDDVTKELTRLGLQDYLPGNAVFTSGQNLLPGNEFGRFGEDATGDEGQWYFYGGQQYRVGGDQDNFVDYVNGKTGNLKNNLSYIFNDMANNPYAQQDPAFMQQYQQGQSQFNNANGSITGNTNVDNVINYVNSLNNYNQAIGGNSGSSLLEMLQGYLNSGLQANQDFIAQQRAMAEQQAQRQASDAYVNMVLAGDAAKEQMSALGLGTTGALQSALMGVQGNYSNNLATIDQNLATMLNGLSEQELQVLTDYYKNMTNYAYQVSNDEENRALQKAQLALQQQQAQYEQQMAERELALKLQQYEWEQQQYADTLAQREFDNDITKQELALRQQAQEFDMQQALKKLNASNKSSRTTKSSGTTVNQISDDDVPAGNPVTYPPIAVTMPYTFSVSETGLLDKLAEKQVNQIAEQYKAADIGAMLASDVVANANRYYGTDTQALNQFANEVKNFSPASLMQALYNNNAVAMLEGETVDEYLKRTAQYR